MQNRLAKTVSFVLAIISIAILAILLAAKFYTVPIANLLLKPYNVTLLTLEFDRPSFQGFAVAQWKIPSLVFQYDGQYKATANNLTIDFPPSQRKPSAPHYAITLDLLDVQRYEPASQSQDSTQAKEEIDLAALLPQTWLKILPDIEIALAQLTLPFLLEEPGKAEHIRARVTNGVLNVSSQLVLPPTTSEKIQKTFGIPLLTNDAKANEEEQHRTGSATETSGVLRAESSFRADAQQSVLTIRHNMLEMQTTLATDIENHGKQIVVNARTTFSTPPPQHQGLAKGIDLPAIEPRDDLQLYGIEGEFNLTGTLPARLPKSFSELDALQIQSSLRVATQAGKKTPRASDSATPIELNINLQAMTKVDNGRWTIILENPATQEEAQQAEPLFIAKGHLVGFVWQILNVEAPPKVSKNDKKSIQTLKLNSQRKIQLSGLFGEKALNASSTGTPDIELGAAEFDLHFTDESFGKSKEVHGKLTHLAPSVSNNGQLLAIATVFQIQGSLAPQHLSPWLPEALRFQSLGTNMRGELNLQLTPVNKLSLQLQSSVIKAKEVSYDSVRSQQVSVELPQQKLEVNLSDFSVSSTKLVLNVNDIVINGNDVSASLPSTIAALRSTITVKSSASLKATDKVQTSPTDVTQKATTSGTSNNLAFNYTIDQEALDINVESGSYYVPPLRAKGVLHLPNSPAPDSNATPTAKTETLKSRTPSPMKLQFTLENQCQAKLVDGTWQQATEKMPARLSFNWKKRFVDGHTLRRWLNTSLVPVDFTSGEFTGNVSLKLSPTPTINTLDLRLENVDGVSSVGTFSGVQLQLSPTPPHSATNEATKNNKRLWPLSIAATVNELNTGTVMTNTTVNAGMYSLNGEWQATFREAHTQVFGGTATLKEKQLTLKEPMNINIMLDKIQLSKVVETQGTEGLNTAGEVSGHIPIRIQNGEFIIEDGLVSNVTSGSIRYASALTQSADVNPQLKLTLQILEDFQFSELQSNVSYENDTLTFSSHIKGKNPKVKNGRPVDFNLNTEVALGSAIQAMRLQSGIESRLETFVTSKVNPSTHTLYCEPR